jgi:hypothetical protein
MSMKKSCIALSLRWGMMFTEEKEIREVYIEVLGGVAHIVSAPDDVDVYIIDLDEEKES